MTQKQVDKLLWLHFHLNIPKQKLDNEENGYVSRFQITKYTNFVFYWIDDSIVTIKLELDGIPNTEAESVVLASSRDVTQNLAINTNLANEWAATKAALLRLLELHYEAQKQVNDFEKYVDEKVKPAAVNITAGAAHKFNNAKIPA